MKSHVALFIFHRDLRLVDNSALYEAIEWCRSQTHPTKLVCAFVFTKDQVDANKNKYFSNSAVQFMCQSLVDLNGQLEHYETRLHILKSDNQLEALDAFIQYSDIRGVFFNKDYSVYATQRDTSAKKWCDERNVHCSNDIEDYDLIPLHKGLLADGRPYTNLSQYYAKFVKGSVEVRTPLTKRLMKEDFKILNGLPSIDIADVQSFYTEVPEVAQQGGRVNGLRIIKDIKSKKYEEYSIARDFPALDNTTKTSAHLHFGTISVREMYHAIHEAHGFENGLLRELVFRSFYLKIYALYPKLQRGAAFREDMDKHIPWISKTSGDGKDAWKAWTLGTTGYPLVDAGMRQLMTTGWMHNRVRMLVATTATRYFLLDWRECARFFYTCLVDADTFSNTAGWQWSAGVGPDAAPYFRAPMNPFIQSKKFDEDARYIKKWVPELRDVTPQDIHRWGEQKIRDKYIDKCTYPAPLIEQKTASKRATDAFKAAHKNLMKNL